MRYKIFIEHKGEEMTNYDIDKELNIVQAVINALSDDDVVSVKVKKYRMKKEGVKK